MKLKTTALPQIEVFSFYHYKDLTLTAPVDYNLHELAFTGNACFKNTLYCAHFSVASVLLQNLNKLLPFG